MRRGLGLIVAVALAAGCDTSPLFPDMVAGDLLLDRLRETVRARTLSLSVNETRLVTSNLGEHAIAVGAGTLVLQAALRDRALFPTPLQVSA